MYCSTCGAHVPAGRSDCTTCGAWVSPAGHNGAAAPGVLARAGAAAAPVVAGHACPRCGYNGDGISYFSKGSHIAALVVLGMVSWLVFALIYFAAFHNHQICPRCGKDWGNARDLSTSRGRAVGAVQPALAGGGSAANGWSIALLVLAAILVIAGLTGGGAGPVLFGAAAGGGGLMLQSAARKEREARRAALLSNLQLPVLKLAAERNGRLTVTETAAALGWPLPRAEKVLNSLEDGVRVNSEVTDEGVIVYEFRELAHGPGRLPPSAA